MNVFAIVDIGTLKVKTEIASVNPDGTLRHIYHSNNLTCFGVGLDENDGNVQDRYLERTITELQRVKQVLQQHQVSQFKVVSTHAMRRAKNREQVRHKMETETGFSIENISQEQEAGFFFTAVMRTFQNRDREYAVVDVGGGSVQVLIGTPEKLRAAHMMQTGAQVLHEQFGTNPHEPTGFNTEAELEKMRQKILDELVLLEAHHGIPVIYGSSIIIDVMKGIGLPLEPYTESSTHPYKTYQKYMAEFITKILPLTFAQREEQYDIQKGFMWAIDKGFLNILTISDYLQSPFIIPSNANIAQGIIYSLDSQK